MTRHPPLRAICTNERFTWPAASLHERLSGHEVDGCEPGHRVWARRHDGDPVNAPVRIERKRRRGWRMPDDAVYVGRPSTWGNPFRITRSSDFHGLHGSWFVIDPQGTKHHPDEDSQRSARQKAVDLFAAWVTHHDDQVGGAPTTDRIRNELAGHDLVCWCPSQQPCHADVLIEIANSTGPVALRTDRAAGLLLPRAPNSRSAPREPA